MIELNFNHKTWAEPQVIFLNQNVSMSCINVKEVTDALLAADTGKSTAADKYNNFKKKKTVMSFCRIHRLSPQQ